MVKNKLRMSDSKSFPE